MTITLYLESSTSLRDLKTLQQIFNASEPKLVEPLKEIFTPLAISSKPFANSLQISVTMDEFCLIGIFNGSSF